MRRFFLTALTTLFIASQTITAQAEIIPLIVDSTQSTITISLNGNAADTSSVSGTGTLDVASPASPFGLAQLADLDLVLDDDLTLLIASGLFGATASTNAGDITVSLDVPGPAGVVSGGAFDQLGNSLSFGGDLLVQSLLADQTFALGDLDPATVDFTDVQISQSSSLVTIVTSFQVNDIIEGTPLGDIPFVADGVIVATGQVAAVPEPAAAILLLGVCAWFPTRRVR